MFGGYDDSDGLRYIIQELYFMVKDFKGALIYYRWFSKAFPDDIGFPVFNLLLSTAYFENNKIPKAVNKAYETAFSNTYLFDLINGKEPIRIDKSESIGFENLEYARKINRDCIKLITPEFQIWIGKLS